MPEEIDSLEASLTSRIGATNASPLLELIGSHARSSDPAPGTPIDRRGWRGAPKHPASPVIRGWRRLRRRG